MERLSSLWEWHTDERMFADDVEVALKHCMAWLFLAFITLIKAVIWSFSAEKHFVIITLVIIRFQGAHTKGLYRESRRLDGVFLIVKEFIRLIFL